MAPHHRQLREQRVGALVGGGYSGWTFRLGDLWERLGRCENRISATATAWGCATRLFGCTLCLGDSMAHCVVRHRSPYGGGLVCSTGGKAGWTDGHSIPESLRRCPGGLWC